MDGYLFPIYVPQRSDLYYLWLTGASYSNALPSYLYLNRENYRLFLERIQRVIVGVFLSSPGWYRLRLLLAYPTHRIFRPSP